MNRNKGTHSHYGSRGGTGNASRRHAQYSDPTETVKRFGAGKHADRGEESPAKHPSGRPTFDSRGTASWEWQTEEEGKFSADIDTQQLKTLEATELSLEDTAKMKKLNLDALRDGEARGFDPYDRGAVGRRGSALGAAEHGKKEQEKARDKKPRKDLRKYDEWPKSLRQMHKNNS